MYSQTSPVSVEPVPVFEVVEVPDVDVELEVLPDVELELVLEPDSVVEDVFEDEV